MPYKVLDPNDAEEISAPVPNPAAPSAIGLTLASAREELRAGMKGRSDIPAERYNFWLNRAYIDLATSTKLDELQASMSFDTVEDQALYLLPEIVITTMTLSRVDEDHPEGGVPVEKIDLPAYRRRKDSRYLGFVRKPTAFFRNNRLLVLHPTPDDTYEMILDFRFEPLPLTEDTHCPVFRAEWHESWLLLARKKMLSAVAEWEASIAAGNDFAAHARTRQDREANEDENRVPMSSRPRSHKDMRRRNQHPNLRDF